MPSRIVGSLSMHSTAMPASWPRSTSAAARRGSRGGPPPAQRHLDREMRAAADRGGDLDRVIEHARDAFDDRKPEPEAARHLGALVEPVELREDAALLGARNADPGIVDVDAQLAAAPAAADQHAALRRVFDGVGDEVLQQAPQQPAVRADRERAAARRSSRSPFSRASGANSTSSWRSKSSMRKLTISGFSAPVSSREMSSSAPRISSTASSEASMLPTSCGVVAAAAGARPGWST